MANVLIGDERTRGEKAIGIAERLYEARRVQRWLLGDAYGRLVRDPMAILRKLAPEHGGVLGALHTVLVDMRREALENAWLGALLAAAAVELLEPDGLTPAEATEPRSDDTAILPALGSATTDGSAAR